MRDQARCEATRAGGVLDGNVCVGPLVVALITNTDSPLIASDTKPATRQELPGVQLTLGLSTISFGLPARSYVVRVFSILALAAGLVSAILDRPS